MLTRHLESPCTVGHLTFAWLHLVHLPVLPSTSYNAFFGIHYCIFNSGRQSASVSHLKMLELISCVLLFFSSESIHLIDCVASIQMVHDRINLHVSQSTIFCLLLHVRSRSGTSRSTVKAIKVWLEELKWQRRELDHKEHVSLLI